MFLLPVKFSLFWNSERGPHFLVFCGDDDGGERIDGSVWFGVRAEVGLHSLVAAACASFFFLLDFSFFFFLSMRG